MEDCFEVKPTQYWVDFGLSISLAWVCFVFGDRSTSWALQASFFIASSLLFYRSMLFIHELTHLRREDIPYFSIAWNLLAGIPLMLPSFMYRGVHLDHHKRGTYGTKEDGEYSAFGGSSPLKLIPYFLQCFSVPVALYLRFALLNPISLLHPALRKLLMERGSALAIQFEAKRKIPSGIDLRNWKILDFLTSLHVYFASYLFISHVLAWSTLLHFYGIMVAVLFVNSIRTVVAHRYTNQSLQEMSFQDQLLDSINVEGNIIFHELMAPVGLRNHGLHHLFPSMPYHSLETAHRYTISPLCRQSLGAAFPNHIDIIDHHLCHPARSGLAISKN